MTLFTWLHLSDLHLRSNPDSLDKDHLRKMRADIARQMQAEALTIDAVFFTGDVAFSGQEPEYGVASEWFDSILETCGLANQRHRIFLIPGNHDVNRYQVTRATHTQLLHQDLARRLLIGDDYSEINKWLGSSAKQENEEDRRVAFQKLENFAQFVKDFFPHQQSHLDHNRLYDVRSIEKKGHTVVVLCLNSAWLSFQDDEQGRLLLGELQVLEALADAHRMWPEACLHIALIHHPLYWLAEKDIQRILQHLPGNCDIVLRGHLHCPSLTFQSTPDTRIAEFAAGASLKAHYHAYNITTLNLETFDGTAIVRLQHPDIGGNWGADTFTYRNSVNGKIDFRLLRRVTARGALS